MKVSLDALQSIVGRAVVDPEFRESLKTDPDAVFATRAVTPEEATALKAMNWDSIASVGADLEQRVSRFAITRVAAGCH